MKGLYILSLLLSLIGGVLPNMGNYYIGKIPNDVTTSEDFMSSVRKNLNYFVIFQAEFCFIWLLKDILMGYTNPQFIADIRKIMNLDLTYFDKSQQTV